MHVRARVLGAALLLSAAASAPTALAQKPPTATAEERKLAARDFAEGDRQFKEGDYRGAALSYERAYGRVPHHSALWNAARSWHRAGELAKAANLYAQYLREAPPNARDRNNAQKALNELSNKLARLEIHASDVTDVKVDGNPITASSVFVTPGQHLVEGQTKDGATVRQPQDVQAGDVVSVALVPPPPSAAPPPPAAEASPTPTPAPPRAGRGWSPIVVYFEGAVTLALAGITVWSGLDTLQQKDAFDRNPTQDNLDVGKQKQARTNVLIGASAAAGALTALTAILLVDWHARAADDEKKQGEPHVTLGAGLGTVTVRGEF
jgi:tetratricopeptide (TPR) repeat protein